MVSGKPTLTFGSGSQQVSGKARDSYPRSVRGKLAAEFASYLPKSEMSPNTIQSPAMAKNAVVNTQPPSRVHVGYTPVAKVSTSYQPGGGDSGERSVADGKSYAKARSEANARFNRGFNTRGEAVATPRNDRSNDLAPVRTNKKGPRLAGQPVTGRRTITMGEARPSTRGMGKLAKSAQQSAPSNNGGDNDKFTGFGLDDIRTIGSQSFIAQGFGGKNAEKALKHLGYDPRALSQAQVKTQARLIDQGALPGEDGNYRLGKVSNVQFLQGEEAGRMAVLTAANRKIDGRGNRRAGSLIDSFAQMAEDGLGALAARFESGADGIAAIGYDRKGGTSYGKYQIASRTGTMARFLDYLKDNAPDLAKRLASAGPANTGGRNGGMPQVWRAIAQENPQRFEDLQGEFIRTSHYEPAVNSISRQTGLALSGMPPALREVVFSTAVQHGPAGAVRIISQAINKVGSVTMQNALEKSGESLRKTGSELIRHIYALRAGQFGSSTSHVQASVKNRLSTEMREALQMLA